MTRVLRLFLPIAVLAAWLAACGGGGGDGVGSSGTGFGASLGSISGFGSVIVEGTRYDDSAATVTIERDPSAPAAATSGDLRLGMQVEVRYAGTAARSVAAAAEVVGPFGSATADGLIVAGQTVRIAAAGAPLPTVLDGFSAVSELAATDWLEVHGQRDAAGVIQATRVERLDAGTTQYTRVSGPVTGDATTGSFQIAGLTIGLSPSTRRVPAGAVPAAGSRVTVWSPGGPSRGVLSANVLVVRGAVALDESAPASAGGVVTGLDRTTQRFRLAGVTVDASAATFVGGTAASLSNGDQVRVAGTATAGVLKAAQVTQIKDAASAPEVEITATITDYVSSASFRLRGTPVDASGAGVTFSGGTAANLVDGTLVKVEGRAAGGVLVATKVTFQTKVDSRTTAFLGTIDGWNATTGTFSVQGVPMRLAANAAISASSGATVTRADIRTGMVAELEGAFDATGTFVVAEAKLRVDATPPTQKVDGKVYLLTPALQSFTLNGGRVRWTSTTRFDNGVAGDLVGGMTVRVEGAVVSGVLIATRITLRP